MFSVTGGEMKLFYSHGAGLHPGSKSTGLVEVWGLC